MRGDQRCGPIPVTWRIRCRTHCVHVALSALWAEEIRIHHAIVPVVFVSLLFCQAAWCAGFYSKVLGKMSTLYSYVPQLLPTVKFNVKSEEQGNRDGKALCLVSANVLLCVQGPHAMLLLKALQFKAPPRELGMELHREL